MNSIDLLSEKYKNGSEIIKDLDSLVYFFHDDVERIFARKNGRMLSWEAYSYSIDVTRNQILEKQHLDGIKRFMQLEATSALRWLIARLTNNSLNYYCSVKNHKITKEDVWYEESQIYEFIDIETIKNQNPKLFKEVFERLSRDALFRRDDFDFYDFEYLCGKYGLNLSEYVLSPVAITAEIASSGGAQLLFGFDDHETETEIEKKNNFAQRLNMLKKHKKIKRGRLF